MLCTIGPSRGGAIIAAVGMPSIGKFRPDTVSKALILTSLNQELQRREAERCVGSPVSSPVLASYVRPLLIPPSHHAHTLILDGKLCLAPIKDDIQKVVDVGTGTGSWAMGRAS